MRVVYYTHTAFFEAALGLIRQLSRLVTLHVVLEVAPGAWESAGFDLQYRALPPGLVPADPVLAPAVPAAVRESWRNTASFHLAVHPSKQSLHPSSWRVTREVLRHARRVQAGILHVDDVDVSPRLSIGLPFAAAPPLVISVHDPQPHTGEQNWRMTLARRIAFPRARRFVLYNASWRAAFAARHTIPLDRVDTIPLGVYDVFREWAPAAPARSARPTVLFFGRLSPYKGLDIFYDAARIVASRVPSVQFVIAGRPIQGYTPPPPPSLPAGATFDVRFRYLANAELTSLLQTADVVACPYRDATQSGVVLTAFAFGVPVVATETGGLSEYVRPGRTGLLVPVGDAAALADAIAQALLDPVLAKSLRDGVAHAAAGDLHSEQTAAALVRTYQLARG